MGSLQWIIFTCVFSVHTVLFVESHANMLIPNNWFDHQKWLQQLGYKKFDYIGMKSGLQCAAGCDYRGDEICPGESNNCGVPAPGCGCFWFQNATIIKNAPTLLDPKLRTYPYYHHPHYNLGTPWFSPGSAHVDSPCGVGGGNMHGCVGDCTRLGGYPKGPKAEVFFNKHKDFKVTNWTRGSVVEAAWGILANHGGGYSYRLCKVPEEGIIGVTEECFQKTPLKFEGDMQWIQFGEDESTRFSFPAVRTDKGTTPHGSQWTKNPIPACRGGDGGFHNPDGGCPQGTQYAPPREDIFGFGVNVYSNITNFKFSVIDQLVIPKTLDEGDYVLSFRWDCEQTPQVWNTCASIRLQ